MKKLFCKNECKDNGKCGIFKIVAIAGTVIAVLVGFGVLICKKFSSKNNEEDTEEFDDFDDFDDDFDDEDEDDDEAEDAEPSNDDEAGDREYVTLDMESEDTSDDSEKASEDDEKSDE